LFEKHLCNKGEGIFSGIGGIAEMAELAEIAKIAVSNNPGALYIGGRKIMQLGKCISRTYGLELADSRTELEITFNNKSRHYPTLSALGTPSSSYSCWYNSSL